MRKEYPPELERVKLGEGYHMTRELKPLTDDMLRAADIPALEEMHSEMLATASDLGFQPSDSLLVTIETVAQGAQICKGLHEQITRHVEKLAADAGKEASEKVIADVPGKSDTAGSGRKEKKPAKEKSASAKMAEQKAARLARDAAKQQAAEGEKPAAPTKESKVAKKAAKKKVAKKSAKKGAKKTGAKRSKFDPASKIHWIRTKEGNGAREGTPRHERREVLRKCNGQSVKTFLEKGGKSSTLARAVKDKDARVEAPAAK